MQGYGYSVWAVPNNYKTLQKNYNLTHIPHVTISTNHMDPPCITNYKERCKIVFPTKNLYRLTAYTYETDPINTECAGFLCKVPGINESSTAHMTISYDFDGDFSVIHAPKGDLDAMVWRADTRSENPSDWRIY